jgi:hypothetical protein
MRRTMHAWASAARVSGAIEWGKQNATLRTVWEASRVLGVRPAELLDEDVQTNPRE